LAGRPSEASSAAHGFLSLPADDEDAVDELLEALADQEFDLAWEEDAEPPTYADPSDEAKKVADLLDSLRTDSGHPAAKEDNTSIPPADEDDSDSEQMTRAVESLLAQIGDEINNLPPVPAPAGPPGNGNRASPEPHRSAEQPGDEPGADDVDDDADADAETPFTLPTVPSQLVDPVPDTTTTPETDFDRSISARMASLRGLGALDALGLPSAPTFRPGEQDTTTATSALLRPGRYTDADQKTWCVVCLDDATVRCAGCDGDVYCARCWREMHVGPSAGYDERGHQWAKF
jgi:hypothetical protein